MKKIFILIYALSCLGTAEAQYTKLFDFNGTNGDQPFGSVILSDNDSVLYGMTNGGGTSNGGLIFSMHADGTGYINLHTFTEDTASGSNPYGSLIRAGNVLYGMTSGYGHYGQGTIFSIHTDGSGYTKLHDFSSAIDSSAGAGGGGNPYGTLTISGNILYGMTYGTGGPNKGNVFSIHTDGSAYTGLLAFTGPNGQFPGYGALTLSGNVLYGTTLYGGANGLGVIFSVHTDGTGYNKLLDFDNANGSMPFSSLTLSGNRLYGTTSSGGANNKGTVFSINTDGSGYLKIHDFDGANGQGPNGALILSNGTLYSTAASGGANGCGIIFSVDTTGTGFQNLFNLNTPTGSLPRATLSIAGSMVYGTGVIGGAYSHGTVFSYKIQPTAPPICLVTVDYTNTHNIIVWEKSSLNLVTIDSFIVYREISTNIYHRIGAVSKDSLSTFTDLTANPASTGYRYKLKSKNTQGIESAFSNYHNTIYLSNTGAVFNWTPYQIENNSTPVSNYNIYRDDNSTGSFHFLDNTTGNQFGYTVTDYSSFPNAQYYVEASMINGTCHPTRTAFNASRSNVKYLGTTGIAESNNNSSITIYPNPAGNTLNIAGITGLTKISLFDIVGKLVIEKEASNNTAIDISQLPVGVYTLLIESKTGRVFNKVVISR